MDRIELTMPGGFTTNQSPIAVAQQGHGNFQQYRSYLYLLARSHIGRRNQSRLDASDIVQQTLLNAHQMQSQFRGVSEAELVGWLRQTLANNLADALTGLPLAQREAIVLHHLQGLALAEVGQQLDKSRAAVAGLLHRGFRRLRELMD